MPPNILDSLSTESTVAVRENQNITLTCKADGYPTPKLMWKREDGQNININRHNKGERTPDYRSFSIFRSVQRWKSSSNARSRFVGIGFRKRKCFTQSIKVILKFLLYLPSPLNDRLIFPIRENRSGNITKYPYLFANEFGEYSRAIWYRLISVN